MNTRIHEIENVPCRVDGGVGLMTTREYEIETPHYQWEEIHQVCRELGEYITEHAEEFATDSKSTLSVDWEFDATFDAVISTEDAEGDGVLDKAEVEAIGRYISERAESIIGDWHDSHLVDLYMCFTPGQAFSEAWIGRRHLYNVPEEVAK